MAAAAALRACDTGPRPRQVADDGRRPTGGKTPAALELSEARAAWDARFLGLAAFALACRRRG
jgi:hypothetical protein